MDVTAHLLYVLLKFNQASHCVIIESSRKIPKDCLTREETSFTIVRTDLMIYFSLFFRGFSLFHGRPEIDGKTCTNKPFFGLRIWIQPDPGRIRKLDFRVRPDVFFYGRIQMQNRSDPIRPGTFKNSHPDKKSRFIITLLELWSINTDISSIFDPNLQPCFYTAREFTLKIK